LNALVKLLGVALVVALATFVVSSTIDVGADVVLAVISAVTPPAAPH
jgi:hypothetical protein